jgi:chitinase
MATVEQFNIDGIDIDWGYPGYTNGGMKMRPVYKEDYTFLLKVIRLQFNALGKKLHQPLITSSATAATRIWLDDTNMREASKWLDSVNVTR